MFHSQINQKKKKKSKTKKDKYISLPKNKYNVFSIYLQCLQLSSYKYFILTAQSMSNTTICTIEKNLFLILPKVSKKEI